MTQSAYDNSDPFSVPPRRPAVSFKNKPVGTVVKGTVIDAPKLVQSRDFDTGEPAFWKDGNPKMAAVLGLRVNGEDLSLWAPKPSAMFNALVEAQNKAGQRIIEGGELMVKFTGEKPMEDSKKEPQKLYAAKYEPPKAEVEVDPFADDEPPF